MASAQQAEWECKSEAAKGRAAAAEAEIQAKLVDARAEADTMAAFVETEKAQNELLMQTLHDSMKDKRFDYGKLEQRLKRCAVENAKFKALLVSSTAHFVVYFTHLSSVAGCQGADNQRRE